MATPPPHSSSSPADPVAAGVHPVRPLPPIFFSTTTSSTAQTLLGKPLNATPPPPSSQGLVFPIPRSVPFRSRPAAADHGVNVSGSAGYARGAGQGPVVAFPAGQGRPPFVFPADQTGQRTPSATAVHVMRPPQPQPQQQPQFMVPRQARAPALAAGVAGAKSSPITSGAPKVGAFPVASVNPELNNCKEREKNREDSVVTIHGRKVRLVDGGSGSLYAFCRSWVRNGLPQEPQTTFGNGMKVLPKPNGVKRNKEDNEVEEPREEVGQEHVDSVDDLSANGLLQLHVKHAKKIRARLKKERLLRIERYKQRLALLLPIPSELGRTDAYNGS